MVSLKRVFNTLFPRLGVSSKSSTSGSKDDSTSDISDLDLTDVSVDALMESVSNTMMCKEDQDVVMFLSLVDRMSVKSLLFILQNHAREMNNISELQLQQAMASTGCTPRRGSFLGSNGGHKACNIVKKCRFAEILGGQQVRAQVFEIPHLNDLSEEEKRDVWYTAEEQKIIRLKAHMTVLHYRAHCPGYGSSVRVLAESYDPAVDPLEVERHIKSITQDPHGRGLEPHLCDLPQVCRVASVRAVLSEQERQRFRRSIRSPLCKKGKISEESDSLEARLLHEDTSNRDLVCKNSSGEMSVAPPKAPFIPSDNPKLEQDRERLRNCYLERTLACRTLALKMAEGDHVEALKASLLRWQPQQQQQPSSSADCCKRQDCSPDRPMTALVAPLLL